MKVNLKIKVFWEPLNSEDAYLAKILGKEPARKPLFEMDLREVTIYDISSFTPYYDDIGDKWYSTICCYGELYIVPYTYEEVELIIQKHAA